MHNKKRGEIKVTQLNTQTVHNTVQSVYNYCILYIHYAGNLNNFKGFIVPLDWGVGVNGAFHYAVQGQKALDTVLSVGMH